MAFSLSHLLKCGNAHNLIIAEIVHRFSTALEQRKEFVVFNRQVITSCLTVVYHAMRTKASTIININVF